MRYALNTTPINGWETKGEFGLAKVAVLTKTGPAYAGPGAMGRGRAEVALNVSGSGRLIIHGHATAALVAAGAPGNGRIASLGRGKADLVLNVSGTGYARIHNGGAADIVLAANGDGVVIPQSGGRMLIEMLAAAQGRIAVRGTGAARVEINIRGTIDTRKVRWGHGIGYISSDATGKARLNMRGNGRADIALQTSGRQKDPAIHYGAGLATIAMHPHPASYFTYRQVFAAGDMMLVMTAKAAAPKRLPVPATWRDAPSVRAMAASQETRRRSVQQDGRL